MNQMGTKINLPAVTIDSEGTVSAIYSHNKNLGPTVKDSGSTQYGAF